MDQPGDTLDTIVLNCPSCVTRVAVPATARGLMAKCVKCGGTFRIPNQDEPPPQDEALADEIAIEVLEEPVDQGDATVSLETLADAPDQADQDKTTPMRTLEQIKAQANDDPPDIGDESTPENVKALRRERHRLLLDVGREAYTQILSTAFDEFQSRIKKIDKRARQVRAWLEAVDRTSSEENPLAKRMDMNVDASKAAEQLVELERDRDHAFRVLAEALIRTDQHVNICAEQRERIKAIDVELDVLVPPPPTKKGLLSRFRGE